MSFVLQPTTHPESPSLCCSIDGKRLAQSAGLTNSLAEAYDMVLPDELFEKVLEECIKFEEFEKQERSVILFDST